MDKELRAKWAVDYNSTYIHTEPSCTCCWSAWNGKDYKCKFCVFIGDIIDDDELSHDEKEQAVISRVITFQRER